MSGNKVVDRKVAKAFGIACLILLASLIGTILFFNVENTNLQNQVNNLTQSNIELQNMISNLTPVIIPNPIQTQLVQEHYYYYLNSTTKEITAAQIICNGYMNGSLVVTSPRKMLLTFRSIDFVPNNTDQMIDSNKLNNSSVDAVWFQEDIVPGENLVNLTRSLNAAFNPNLQKLSNITSETVTFLFGDIIFVAHLYDFQSSQIITTLRILTTVFVTINPHSSEFGGYN